jgi:hypothetical protein
VSDLSALEKPKTGKVKLVYVQIWFLPGKWRFLHKKAWQRVKRLVAEF